MRRAHRPLVWALTAVACLAVVASAAASGAPTLIAKRAYGGVTAKRGAFVLLLAASKTQIAASPVNTAPELGHSNINIACSDNTQLNTGMVALKLKLTHGHYGFSQSFVRTGVKPAGSPLPKTYTLTVSISGTVRSSKTIAGTVKVVGPAGCSLPSQSYTAKLQSARR